MYLIINDDKAVQYKLTQRIKTANLVRYIGMPTIPEEIAGAIVMCSDNGMRLSRDYVDDYARQEFAEDGFTLTNLPEPEPPVEPEPSDTEVLNTLLGVTE